MALHGVLDYPGLVWDIATGKKREELEALRSELSAQKKQIESMTATVAAMPDGPKKSEAWAVRVKAQQAWMPVVREFNDAAIAHNEISAAIRKASAGAYDPGRVSMTLSGLGILPVVWVGIVVVGSATVLLSLATLIDSIKSRSTEVRGYMDQFAEIVKQGGGVIEQTGELVRKSANALLVVAGVVGVYYAAKWFQGRKRGSPAGAAS